MKYILVLALLLIELMGATIKTTVTSVDTKSQTVTINIKNIDIGVSGFLVHQIDPVHTSILKSVTVVDFDKESQVATLKMQSFGKLKNNALPSGKWRVEEGDIVELAFGYSRALLIAPSEEIYHQITKSVKIQWIHPDIFATLLSFSGHPTPLKEDFSEMSNTTSAGLLFIYLDKKVYTLDIQSFQILSITDAPLTQDSVVLPFYSRVEEIEANWFGRGSGRLKAYEPHYYELLVESNRKNAQLYEIIKNADETLHHLLKNFELEEKQ